MRGFTLSEFSELALRVDNISMVVDSGCNLKMLLQPQDVAALGLREVKNNDIHCTLENGSRVFCKSYEAIRVTLRMTDDSVAEAAFIPVEMLADDVLSSSLGARTSSDSSLSVKLSKDNPLADSQTPCQLQEAANAHGRADGGARHSADSAADTLPPALPHTGAASLESSSCLSESSSSSFASPENKKRRQDDIAHSKCPGGNEAYAVVETRESPPGSPPAGIAVASGTGERLIGYGALARLGLTLDVARSLLVRRVTMRL